VAKTVEEEKVSGGSAYNLLAVELGLPGLALWIGFTISVLLLGLGRLRLIEDPELRTYLVAILATFVTLTIEGLVGPTLAVTPPGVFLWFAPGVLAYWLAGPGRKAIARSGPRVPAASPALAG
jgi:O-antigen ligase